MYVHNRISNLGQTTAVAYAENLVPNARIVSALTHLFKSSELAMGVLSQQAKVMPPRSGASRTNACVRWRSGFIQTYGWLGVPMFMMFMLSALWTAMLAVIQVAPDRVANTVMGTSTLDFGEFWLLPAADIRVALPSAIALASFAIGYGYLGLAMVFPSALVDQVRRLSSTSRWSTITVVHVRSLNSRKVSDASFPIRSNARDRLYRQLVRFGVWIRNNSDSAVVNIPKLIFQTTTLITYLREGFPLVLIFSFSSLLFTNWMFSSYHSAHGHLPLHLAVIRLFNSFDLFFAVFAPLQVLVYAYYNFEFDSVAFAVRLKTLALGQFETTARLFADPTQVSLFRIAFHHLQLASWTSLGIKAALNLLSIFKWWRTVVHLVEHSHATRTKRESLVQESIDRLKATKIRQRQRIQNVIIAATFFFAGSGIFVHSMGAVISTKHVCKPYEQCKVPSYQWNVGAEYCSCIVFVDRDPGLKTIIQIINRKVPTLPVELRRWVDLEQLILLYTKIDAIPDWTKEFHNLEYLHIQGDLTATQLTYLPVDLFDDMPFLTFLHLGCHIKLKMIPKLWRLHSLVYLTFGMLHSITELPSLDGLVSLRRFSIIDLIQLPKMPSVRKLANLKAFSLLSRNPTCCNGCLPQPCNLTAFSCKNRTSEGEPLVQCSTERIATDDYNHLKSIGSVLCPADSTFDLKNYRQTFFNTDNACGGVKYKQCKLVALTGICYPNMMQTVSCQISAGLTNMRRMEIALRVGEPCDPDVEAWLGCKS